jgi:hypothetical protein
MALGLQELMRPASIAGAVLTLLAITSTSGSEQARAETPPPPSVTDSLRTAANGSPVLLVLVDRAVQARSADGKLSREIAKAPVQKAVYDPTLDLLWVRRSDRLEVIDLRQSAPAAIPIATGLGHEGEFVIQMKGGRTLRAPTVCDVAGSVIVKWTAPVSIKTDGFDENGPPHPRLVGAPWLTKELGRARRQVAHERLELPVADQKPAMKLADLIGKCPDPGTCGTAVDFGKTGWQLVYTGEDEGEDCRHYRCLLRDSTNGKVGKPPRPGEWSTEPSEATIGQCGLYRFDPSGRWYAIGRKLCSAEKECIDLGAAQPIGWLDGGPDVGTDG